MDVVTLFSNGLLLDAKRRSFLKIVKPQSIDITLYGSSNETYGLFCGVNDGFSRVIENIESSLEEDLPISLKMFITSENAKDFEGVSAIADRLGLPFRYDSTLFPTFDGGKEPLSYALNTEKALMLDIVRNPDAPEEWFNPTRKDPYSDEDILSAWTLLRRNESGDCLFRCKAGRTSLFITCDNEIRMCYMIPTISANLNTTSVSDAWMDFGRIVSIPAAKDSPCSTCEDKYNCNICPAYVYCEYGDYLANKKIDFFCETMRKKHEIYANYKDESASASRSLD